MALTLHLPHTHAAARDRAADRLARRTERQVAADRDAAFWDNVEDYLRPPY
jgi:hypothetical protein